MWECPFLGDEGTTTRTWLRPFCEIVCTIGAETAGAGSTLGAMPEFRLDAAFTPAADQPKAITQITEAVSANERFTTLLGATGTGKTMTMAATIERLQRPALVLAHNKTLAAQLCNEFRMFFPDNAVEYFVSYYDYYQPEAYVPSKDLYIEKDSAINQEVDRLRHAATAALFARRDVIIVASVSAIYGMGSPETYDDNLQLLAKGGDRRPRRAAAQARLDPVHPQRHGARPRLLPRARRGARGVPGLRGDGLPRHAVRRRDRAPAGVRPADRRAAAGRHRARRHLARDALQRQGGRDGARGRGDRQRAQRPLRRARGRGQAAREPPPAPAHAVRHGDAARDGLLQRHRELLAASSTAAGRATARTA